MTIMSDALLINENLSAGGCDLDKSYDGPNLPTNDDGQYTITREFILQMIELFKEGKSLPRRFVST